MKNIKLFNFTTLSLEEKKMILEWRNNPNIRKWMYTQDNITLENHLKFIEELKIKDDQLYFLVKKNENYIGVIDFIDINPNISLKMGIYTNPTLKGNGKILLETIINFSFEILKVEKIFSEVFFENEKAYNLYKSYNFKEVENKVINNKIVIGMEKKMKIGNFNLEKDGTYIIAELSANHNGNLQIALDTIKMAKEIGANAVKIQTYTADTLTLDCDNEDFIIKGGTLWDNKSLYKLYQEAFTPWEWHKELFDYARSLNIDIFSTPFDKSAVDFLEQFNPSAYKIASFEITDYELIRYTASKGKPIIIRQELQQLMKYKMPLIFVEVLEIII